MKGRHYFFFLWMLVVCACSRSDVQPGSYLEAVVDDEVFGVVEDDINLSFVLGDVTKIVATNNDNDQILIQFSSDDRGLLNIADAKNFRMELRKFGGGPYNDFIAQEGSMDVVTYSDNVISGTFSFDAEDLNGGKVKVEEGEFTINY